jgi:phage head maturation protease
MSEQQHGPIEIRHQSELVDVSFPQRMIELIVMPYEKEAEIVEGGRRFTEIVSRGAFDGVQRRLSKIRVNLDHNVSVDGTVGRTLALHPNREEGLVAEVMISKTRDDVLMKASEGLVDVSAGFAVMAAGNGHPRGEEWRGSSYRRLTRLWLGHISLVTEPAHDTRVLAVRDAAESGPVAATPLLDGWLAQQNLDRWLAAEAVIDQRYHRASR